jgi:DNA-binding XRE family transcriptional regulator
MNAKTLRERIKSLIRRNTHDDLQVAAALARDSTSERIRSLREMHGISQTTLGQVLGMTIPTYRRRECGDVSWTIDELEILAATFGVSVHDLIGER